MFDAVLLSHEASAGPGAWRVRSEAPSFGYVLSGATQLSERRKNNRVNLGTGLRCTVR